MNDLKSTVGEERPPLPPDEPHEAPVKEPPDKPDITPDAPVREPEPTAPTRFESHVSRFLL